MGLQNFLKMLRGIESVGDRIALSVFAGFLIWIASPFLTGHEEPWDAKGLYCVASLFVSGGIAGLLGTPRNFWLWPIALWVGQSLFGLHGFLRDLGFFPGGSAGMNFFIPNSNWCSFFGNRFGPCFSRRRSGSFSEKAGVLQIEGEGG